MGTSLLPSQASTNRPVYALVLFSAVLLFVGFILSTGAVGSFSFLGDNGAGSEDLSFEEVGAERGFNYTSWGESELGMTKGGGVYVTDFDNDGWQDVLVTGGTGNQTEHGWGDGGPVLFRNNGGEFEHSGALQDISIEVLGALFFDYDNDGWQDLLLLPIDGQPVFLENQQGEFVRRDVGLNVDFTEPTGATVADYDGDGFLDLFIFQNGEWSEELPAGFHRPNQSVSSDNGNPNFLFRGNGSGFTRVENSGIEGDRWSLAASFVDVTGDGHPDIHVANDYNYDILYVNQGDGTFRSKKLSQTDRNGMASEVHDVNRDGRPDIFVTNIYVNMSALGDTQGPTARYFHQHLGERIRGNNLLINREGGEFTDQAAVYGVQEGGWGWAASFVDFKNTGQADLIQTAQYFDQLFLKSERAYLRYPVVYERVGDEQFQLRDSPTLGFQISDGAGISPIDYDRDGDQDVIIGMSTAIERYQLYENQAEGENWITVDVRGAPNQTPLGTRVYVTINGEERMKIRNAKADFASQEPRTLHFGLGDQTRVDRMRVIWPDGKEHTFEDIGANQGIIVYRNGTARMKTAKGTTGRQLLLN